MEHGMPSARFAVGELVALERGGKGTRGLGIVLLTLYTPPGGPTPEELEGVAEELLDAAEKAAGKRPDAILVVVEPFHRSLWESRSEAVKAIIEAWERDGMPIKGVGGSFMQPVKVVFDGAAMEEAGLTEEEALQWLEHVAPPGIPVVVEFWYFKTHRATNRAPPTQHTTGNPRRPSLPPTSSGSPSNRHTSPHPLT